MSISDSEDYNLLDRLAEEFVERFRRGERPALKEYTDRYPDLAVEILALFPALVKVEQADEANINLEGETTTLGPRRSPEQIGDYRIVGVIGRGGMGVVYEAEQVSLGRRVALKVLPRHASGDRMVLERFRREARAAAQLHHTNIVPVYDVGHDGDIRYYAMQFIQGQSLEAVVTELRHLRIQSQSKGHGAATAKTNPQTRTVGLSVARSILTGGFLPAGDLRTRSVTLAGQSSARTTSATVAPAEVVAASAEATEAGPLSEFAPDASSAPTPISSAVLPGGTQLSVAEMSHRVFHRSVAHIGRQAASALVHAHSRGVIHRDIKPSNLLLDTDGVVWVTDFGLAKAEDDGLTQTGDVLGTIRYMAPERFRGQADPRSDVYALGLTLYELLVLRPAFDSPNRLALVEHVKNVDPPRPRSIDPRIPPDLETIVLKAIEKDAKARYASADLMSEDLRRFLADEPILARQVGAVERYWRWARRNKVIAIMGAALTAAAVLVTIGSLLAAGLYATVADRANRSAAAERSARVEAVQARRTAETARGAAQDAQQAMQQIAAQAEAAKETAQRENYRSTIKLAESMLHGDVQAKYRVADILWGAQPELRGWEWGHLMAHCPLEEWSLQTRQDGLDTLAASSDGRLLATAGRDGTVALWDTWTRKQLWRQRTGRVKTLAIDPRSRYVGVGSAEASRRAFRILDIAAGRLAHESAGTGSGDIAFSPGGNDFFVLGDRDLERFGTDTWALLNSVPVSRSNLPVDHLLWLFVDSAGAFVGVNDDGVGPPPGLSADHPRCSLFDAQTLKPAADLDPILPTYARNLSSLARPALHSGFGEIAYSDGPFLCVADFSNRHRGEIEHSSIVTRLAFDPRSKLAIAASHDGAIVLRDGDGKIRTMFHGSPIRGLILLPDGRVVTGGADGLIKCWNPNLAANLAASTSPQTDSASSEFVAFAEDGNQLLFQNFNRKQNWLFEMSDLSSRVVLGPEGYGHGFPLIQPGTNELVADHETGLSFYGLFRKGTGVVKSRSIDFARPYKAAFDASGRILVVSNLDQEVAVFDVDSHKRLAVPEAQGTGLVAVNPAGTRAALLAGTSLQVWDVATGRVLNRLDEPYGKFRLENDEPVPNPHWLLVFHPDGDLVAFVKPSENSSSTLVLWDAVLGKTRGSIQTEPGRPLLTFAFSPDGNRIFTHDGAIWDWRIGKELFALSGARVTNAVAPSPDGLTLAVAGWNPSLFIAKALPWNKLTRRDEGFYRAVDDLRTYSVHIGFSVAKGQEKIADEAEILGDIELRRGQAALAVAHYSRAIEIRQTIVGGDASKAQWQYRLATLHEKRLALTGTSDPAGVSAVLKEAVRFWQKLVSSGRSHQVARRYLLDLELRLADLDLARNGKGAKEFLLPEIALWCAQSKMGADNRLVRYGLRELWARSAAAVPGLRGDEKAIDDLVERHPELTVTIGDQYAAGGNWERTLAFYSKAITPGSGIDHVRKLLELGGIGPGKSKAPLDVAAKARVRRRALIWLKAELTAATKLVESGPPAPRPAIDEALEVWTEREDIREAQASAKLPADEHTAWQTLWADVDSLRKRVPAPKAMATNLELESPQALDAIHRNAHSLEPAKPREAEPLFRQALEGYRRTQGPDAHLTIDLTLDLARVLERLGRGDEAEPLLLDAIERAHKQFGPGDPRIFTIVNGLATSLAQRGKWAAGEPVFREALERARKQLGPEDPRLSGFMAPLGQSLIVQGKWLEAEPVLRECAAIREKQQPDDWSTFNTRSLLGASLLGQKKYVDAEPMILSGYEGLKAREARIPPQGKARLTEAAERVVKLYEAWEKKDKAAEWRAKLGRP